MNVKGYLFSADNIKTHDGFAEELEACACAAEKHGIVFGQLIEDRQGLIDTARKVLPRYSLTEKVNTDCVFIKQSVVDMFGIPDDTGGGRYEAFLRYYDKVNSFGFSAVVAHHALYSYTDEPSGAAAGAGPGGNRPVSEVRSGPIPPARNRKKASSDLALASAAASAASVSPEEQLVSFLPLLDDDYYAKKRILFECINLPPTHCGTSEVMLAAFEAFCRLYNDKYDIFMLTNEEAAGYHNLETAYDNILYPGTISGVFHLGYVPVQMHRYEPQLLLAGHCLKVVQQVLDIIMVRSYKYHDLAARANIDLGIRLSDGITFISGFSKDDFMAYYANEGFVSDGKKFKVIYVTKEFCETRKPPGVTEMTEAVNDTGKLPFDDFILIVGNQFKHKVIRETVEVIKNSRHNFVVVGAGKTGVISRNIYGYRSGQLDDAFMERLYAQCRAILFPSIYEGFGLPVVMGFKNNKRVIVFDNALNRELYNHFSDFRENFIFFSSFGQIGDILDNENLVLRGGDGNGGGGGDVGGGGVGSGGGDGRVGGGGDGSGGSSPVGAFDDSWDRVAGELEAFFAEILGIPADLSRLRERQRLYAHIEEKAALSQYRDYKLSSLLKFSLKENIKHRHPGVFKFLKKLKG